LKRVIFIILLLLGVLKAQANCATGIVATPIIDSISVLPNGDISICWHMPLPIDPDLAGFNIWIIDGTGANFNLTDPISLGPGVTCYTYSATTAPPPAPPGNNSGSQTVQILVEAFDNCPLPGPNSSGVFPGGFFNTIYLKGEFAPCTSSILLNWNAYDAFENTSIVRYEVFVSRNGAPAIIAGSTFSTNFSYLGVIPNTTYAFYVTAIDNGGIGTNKSTSNIDTADVSGILTSPTFNRLDYITVIDSQQIDIRFSIDTAADVTSYKIQRATTDSGIFVTIESVDKFQGMDTLVDYSDNEVDTDTTAYFYRIEIVNDICGFDSNYSNLSGTILVDVTSNPLEAFNTITMTEYKEWDLGVLRYEVYRAVGGVWELSPVVSLPAFSDTAIYVDDVSEVFDGNGEFCYKVRAVSKGIPYIADSYSNDACALHQPLVYIPNAFAPSGTYNTEFKPILTFTNPSTYLFRVFNRWGEIVFETRDVEQAWNGRYNNSGKFILGGVYFYVLKFNSVEGIQFSKNGTVTIVD